MGGREFQESITIGLENARNRVRNLIGSAHWGEDGSYKEAILRKQLGEMLPNNISIGTGFIVIPHSVESYDQTNQLDIILYDNTIPVLFKEGDFIITTPSNVVAIIEVKTKIDNNELGEIITKLNDNAKKIRQSQNMKGNVFVGIFSYEYTDSIFDGRRSNHLPAPTIKEALENTDGFVNHICLGTDFFIRYWKHDDCFPENPEEVVRYSIYELQKLSYSYFISNLIEMVTGRFLTERYHFMYPIEGTKEVHKKLDIPLINPIGI